MSDFRLEPIEQGRATRREPPTRSMLPPMKGSVTFGGGNDRYRYELRRWWGPGPLVVFIGLNPSTAADTKDDPTLRRCCGFARRWGFDGVIMVNLYALRATDPALLREHFDPMGKHNDAHLRIAAAAAKCLVACWGAHGGPDGARLLEPGSTPVVDVLVDRDLQCLGKNKDGSPRHPLYLRADTPVELFIGRGPDGRRTPCG